MASPAGPPAPRAPIGPPEADNHVVYRRLLFRGYAPYAPVTALQVLRAAVSPGIIRAIRWWFENVVSDVNALNSAAHNLRRRIAAEGSRGRQWRNAPCP